MNTLSRHTLGKLTLGAAAAGTAALGYAAGVEARMRTLRSVELPVLAPGEPPMRILHISDLHMLPGQAAKQRWVAALAELAPDLVVNTGDNLAHRAAIPAVLRAVHPLFAFPGVFVFGSNDYYAPKPKNPLRYLMPKSRKIRGRPLPWRDMRAAFVEQGWQDLTHVRTTLRAGGRTILAAGVDDPHLRRDRYQKIAGAADPGADLRLGLTHSPEPHVLDAFAEDGYDLVLAGHTHGGQLRVPGIGALVTNCGLDRSRARGRSRWGVHMWLHVSAGLGTSPYTPVRFACRPEASLLTLVPRSSGGAESKQDAGAKPGVAVR